MPRSSPKLCPQLQEVCADLYIEVGHTFTITGMSYFCTISKHLVYGFRNTIAHCQCHVYSV